MHFSASKISLQAVGSVPELARLTTPGSGNFCILTDTPVDEVAERLRCEGVTIAAGPDMREGALGPIRSVYFRDPDHNMVEISNQA
ncbi:MAG: hypothetical protein Q8R02_03480 [Hyphomonadaceae bacterium]|nr:hypothetical protein [Hyphomonadaceae bacterium]